MYKCYSKINGNCIGFIFDKSEDCEIFKSLLDKAIYESTNNKPYEYEYDLGNNKSKITEKIIEQNNDFFSLNEKEELENSDNSDNEEANNQYSEIMDIDDNYNEVDSSNNDINKFSLHSLINDKTYCITNDNKIISYKINEENDIIEQLSSKPIIEQFNDYNCFSNGLLFKSENNILFLDKNNPYSLYQYDIEKEKIINEWKTENVQITDICSVNKNAQTTDNPILYGVNSKSIFIMEIKIKL